MTDIAQKRTPWTSSEAHQIDTMLTRWRVGQRRLQHDKVQQGSAVTNSSEPNACQVAAQKELLPLQKKLAPLQAKSEALDAIPRTLGPRCHVCTYLQVAAEDASEVARLAKEIAAAEKELLPLQKKLAPLQAKD